MTERATVTMTLAQFQALRRVVRWARTVDRQLHETRVTTYTRGRLRAAFDAADDVWSKAPPLVMPEGYDERGDD